MLTDWDGFMGIVEKDFTPLYAQSEKPEALFELGLACATGRYGNPDLVAAHKWFNIAAFRGIAAAKRQREEISAEMTRDQIATAQRAARDWLTRH
jgi:uncharacterized protein